MGYGALCCALVRFSAIWCALVRFGAKMAHQNTTSINLALDYTFIVVSLYRFCKLSCPMLVNAILICLLGRQSGPGHPLGHVSR